MCTTSLPHIFSSGTVCGNTATVGCGFLARWVCPGLFFLNDANLTILPHDANWVFQALAARPEAVLISLSRWLDSKRAKDAFLDVHKSCAVRFTRSPEDAGMVSMLSFFLKHAVLWVQWLDLVLSLAKSRAYTGCIDWAKGGTSRSVASNLWHCLSNSQSIFVLYKHLWCHGITIVSRGYWSC